MKITVEKNTLVQSLTRVSKASAPKGPIGALACVMLSASKNGKVSLGCTDLSVSATETIDCEVDEHGDAAINSQSLLARVRAMPVGPVSIHVDKSATILSGVTTRRFVIPSLDTVDMPDMTTPPDGEPALVMLPGTLVRMLKEVMFAISRDNTRPQLNAMLLECSQDQTSLGLRFVATDGHRLVVSEIGNPKAEQTALIPLRGVAEILRLAEALKEDDTVAIYLHDRFVSAECDGKTISVQKIESSFPAWQEVVPNKQPTTSAVVPREACLEAIKAVALSSKEGLGAVAFTFSAGTLALRAEDSACGQGEDEVPVEHTGSNLTIGLKSVYVIEALSALDCQEVMLEMTGDLEPVVVSPLDGDEYKAVIMPLRL